MLHLIFILADYYSTNICTTVSLAEKVLVLSILLTVLSWIIFPWWSLGTALLELANGLFSLAFNSGIFNQLIQLLLLYLRVFTSYLLIKTWTNHLALLNYILRGYVWGLWWLKINVLITAWDVLRQKYLVRNYLIVLFLKERRVSCIDTFIVRLI